MRHGRGCDCDECFEARKHAKHEHCLDCQACLTDENTSDSDGDRCTKCVPCRQECGCDSEWAHAMAEDESMRDFLRDPGPMPAHWDDETRERVGAAVAREQAKVQS